MTEQSAASQQNGMAASHPTLSAPLLYLSSADAGWEDLVAQAFHEPMELEGWMSPATRDISLVLFTGGNMRIERRHINGPWQMACLHQGDLILNPGANIPYEVRWKALSIVPTRTLHLHLSNALITRAAEDLAGSTAPQMSLKGRSGFHDPLLAQIGFALWHELEQQAPAGKIYAQTAAQLLAVHLLRHYTTTGNISKAPSQGLAPQQMRQVIDFVQDRLSQDLSLEDLAQQAGFSPYHFARLFRRTTGESPHQFVLRMRIERAQQLLQRRDIPLAHIAMESGFANQSHFTQVFKRYLGVTPRAYRQERHI
jgi:AraC family transcriptional regulator